MSAEAKILYKAIRPDGRDFHSHSIQYQAAFLAGDTVKHPAPEVDGTHASGYISASTTPLDLPGAGWPLILWEIEYIGESWKPGGSYPNKVAGVEIKGIRQIPAHTVFGSNGEHVAAIVDLWSSFSYSRRSELWAKRPSGYSTAWSHAVSAALSLGVGSGPAVDDLDLFDGGWASGVGAALAVLVRETVDKPNGITSAEYAILTSVWRANVGPAHPDDLLPFLGQEGPSK